MNNVKNTSLFLYKFISPPPLTFLKIEKSVSKILYSNYMISQTDRHLGPSVYLLTLNQKVPCIALLLSSLLAFYFISFRRTKTLQSELVLVGGLPIDLIPGPSISITLPNLRSPPIRGSNQ